jgi:hypothetical protein
MAPQCGGHRVVLARNVYSARGGGTTLGRWEFFLLGYMEFFSHLCVDILPYYIKKVSATYMGSTIKIHCNQQWRWMKIIWGRENLIKWCKEQHSLETLVIYIWFKHNTYTIKLEIYLIISRTYNNNVSSMAKLYLSTKMFCNFMDQDFWISTDRFATRSWLYLSTRNHF